MTRTPGGSKFGRRSTGMERMATEPRTKISGAMTAATAALLDALTMNMRLLVFEGQKPNVLSKWRAG
jgi:hypothetical protein